MYVCNAWRGELDGLSERLEGMMALFLVPCESDMLHLEIDHQVFDSCWHMGEDARGAGEMTWLVKYSLLNLIVET